MSRKDEILKLLSGESQTTQSVNTDSSASVGGINRKDEVLHLLETGKPMDANYFTTELGKIPDFIKQSASDFKNYGYSSSDDVYNGIVSGVDNYKRTIENAKKYNPQWYEENKVDIDDKVKALDDVYNSYAQKRDVYKQFSTEQDFNDAVKYNFYSTAADIDHAINDIKSQKATIQSELDTINANKKTGLVAGSIWESQNGAKINELEKKLQQLDEKEASFTNAKSELKRNQNLRDRYNKKLSFGGVQNVPEFAEYSEKGSKDYTVDVSGSIYDIAQSYNSERNKDGFNNQNKLALFWAITDKYPELLKDGVSIYDIEGVRFNGGEHLDYFITQLKNGMTVGLKDEQGNITESVDIQVSQMDDTQRKIYNYLFAMNGAEVADEYLAVSGEELSKRKGEAEVEALEGKPLKQIWYGFTQAPKRWEHDFLQSMSGLNAQYPVSHPSVYGSQKIKEDETLGGFGRFVFDVAQTSGYQLPAQAVSLLVGGFAGDKASAITNGLMMGMGAAGGAYTEAVNMGYDTDQARSYAIMVGAAETALESLSDGATKAGGLITGNALKKATSGIKSGIGKFAVKLPGKMLSEATEEYLAEVLDTAWKNVAFDRADDLEWLSGDAFYAALLGAVSAVGMGSISSVSDIRFETARDQIIDAGLSLAHDTEAYKLASSLESKKYKLEPKQLQDLSNKIQETTAKMYEAKIEQNRKWYKQIRNELVSLGETGDVSAIASAIVRLKNNDAITVNDLKLIADSKLAADYGFNPSENTISQTEDTQNEVDSVLPKVSAAAPEADDIQDWAFKERGVERLTSDQKMLKEIGKAFGREVKFGDLDRWVTTKKGKRRKQRINGFYDKSTGTIYLNTKSSANALITVFKHELTHFAESDSTAYTDFANGLMDSKSFKDWVASKGFKTEGDVSATLAMNADYRDRYGNSGLKGTEVFNDPVKGEHAANLEMVADFVAESLFSGDMSKLQEALSNVEPEAVNKFKQFLLNILNKIKNLFKKKVGGFETIQGIEAEFIKVCNAAQKAWEQKQQTSEQQKTSKNVKQNLSPDTEGVTENADGEPVAHSVGDGTVQFSLSTYETDGRSQLREYLEKCVSSDRLTQAEMSEMLDGIEEIYDICKEFKDKYAPFGSWSDAAVIRDTHGKPVFSVVTPNGEYKMNLDFSLVCKKRRTLDAVFNLMADEGILDEFELGQKSIVKINEIIRKYGFETACSLCFVDAKRFRQAAVADSFVNLYNELVESLVPESERDNISRFDFSERGLNKEGKQGIDTWDNSRLDFSHLDKVMKEYGSKTVEHKAAKYIKAHPEARKLLIRGEFMSSEDFGAVKTKAPEIMKLYNSKKGTGGPKAAFGDVQYLNEIIKKARNWTPNKAYMVGGVRIQSFSDYMPRMIFDYVQMIYDLAATKLPAHAYTKEVLFVKQFGLTGIKINMSLIPAIAEDGVAPGLDKNGNYVWAGESFDYDAAMEIQNAEGYTENCGTIAVGVSKEHILKLLRDPNIRMVIPYHKSGLNPIVAHMNKIDAFTDYTNSQNTLDKEGKKVAKDFNFNKALHDMGENGSPKAVAKQYLDWCAENDYMPKFAEFSKNANYYKLLEDFNLYDKSGKYAPQREVRAVFPTEGSAFGSMKELIRQGLEEDAIVEGKRNEDLPKIVDEIKRTLPKTEAEISEDAVEQAETDLEARFSYSLPDNRSDLLQRFKDGEITEEEFAEAWDNKPSKENPVSIANLKPEDANTTPEKKRKKGENKGNKESNLYESIQTSDIFNDSFKKTAKDDSYIKTYQSITNKETLNKAFKELEEGGQQYVNKWFNKPVDEASLVDITVGLILMDRYQRIGDYESAMAATERVREMGTASGREVQILSIISRFTPDMMIKYAQKELAKAFELMVDAKTKRWGETHQDIFKLTADEIETIRRKTLQAAIMPDGSRTKAILLAEICTMLQDKIPPDAGTSIRAWQRVSMLLNFKTNIRNIVGNLGMVPIYIASDYWGSVGDWALSKLTGVRTTGVSGVVGNLLTSQGRQHLKKVVKAFGKGIYETYDDFKRGIHTKQEELNRYAIEDFGMVKSDGVFKKKAVIHQGITSGGKSFNEQTQYKLVNAIAKKLNALDNFTSFCLELGDRPFFEMWFMNSLNNQLRLNKTETPTPEMVDIATEEALQRTWQDNNTMTRAVSKIKQAANSLPLHIPLTNYGLGDMLIKFTKTPANIAKAIVDFSPIGLVTAGYKAAQLVKKYKGGSFTPQMQKDVVRTMSNAITGTMFYALVIMGASLGYITFTGDADDDKDVANFEKYIAGVPPYSIEIFGVNVTYDWFQPFGSTLAIAAEFMENQEDPTTGIGEDMWNAFLAAGEVFTQQSFLKSLYEFFSSADENILTGLADLALSDPSTNIPTFLSQVASFFDEDRRSTYDSDSLKNLWNQIRQKLPAVRNQLPEQVNTFGETVENNQYMNVWRAFFSPYNDYPESSGKVADKVYDLYKETGNKSVMPRVAPYKITVKGQTYNFTVEQRNDFQREMGNTSVDMLDKAFKSKEFKQLSDEEKVKVINKIYDYATKQAKIDFLASNYDYELLASLSGENDDGDPILTKEMYKKMNSKAKKHIIEDYFLSKNEMGFKSLDDAVDYYITKAKE